VEFTIVNFWFRKHRQQQFNSSNGNGENSITINPTSKAATRSTKYAYQTNQHDGTLFDNNYLCNYHQRIQKQFSSLNKEELGKFKYFICYVTNN
jgi:hypothetical protein